MTDEDLDRPLEELSFEELKEAYEAGHITIKHIRENEVWRKRINRLVLEQDMEEHRDIYDRLAEV
jgi:hypothetical protein